MNGLGVIELPGFRLIISPTCNNSSSPSMIALNDSDDRELSVAAL